MDYSIFGPQVPTEDKVLAAVKADDALYTSDIAHDCRLPTPAVRRILKRLEARGLVERVLDGNPSSWRKPLNRK